MNFENGLFIVLKGKTNLSIDKIVVMINLFINIK
jgi:hypothetical protein